MQPIQFSFLYFIIGFSKQQNRIKSIRRIIYINSFYFFFVNFLLQNALDNHFFTWNFISPADGILFIYIMNYTWMSLKIIDLLVHTVCEKDNLVKHFLKNIISPIKSINTTIFHIFTFINSTRS